jgi:predicted acyltransferase
MNQAGTQEPIVIHGAISGTTETIVDLSETPPISPPPPVLEPATPPAVETASVPSERVLSLDALRGFLMLAMNLSFAIPLNGVFADWMHHMQYPPPGDFVERAGLTWPDLIFPAFLFTMSAALPIAMRGRLQKRVSQPEIVWHALQRGALLLVFALIIGHVNPYFTADYTKRGNLLAIGGFVLSCAIFLRLPPTVSAIRGQWLRAAGWLGVLTLFVLAPQIYGKNFSLERRDTIMAALAFAAVAGTAIWLCTRSRPEFRIAMVAIIAAFTIGAHQVGWIHDLYAFTPAPWLYQPWYLELMIVVIAGTLAGDLLVRFVESNEPVSYSTARLGALAAVCAAFIPTACAGLYLRQLGFTALALLGLIVIGALLCARPKTERDRCIAQLFSWTAVWLVLGLLLEPLQGGIKKDPQTMSYLAICAGLSGAALIAFIALVDLIPQTRRALRFLAEIGQNPLLAYVFFTLFLNHILYYFGIGDRLTHSWAAASIRAFAIVTAVGWVAWLSSRKKLYWRA